MSSRRTYDSDHPHRSRPRHPSGTNMSFFRNTRDASLAEMGDSAEQRAAIVSQPNEVTLEMYWDILQHALERDPKLAQYVGNPEDWKAPPAAHIECPSGHGHDIGIYLTRGSTTLVFMENDPEECSLNLPTLDNYSLGVEIANGDGDMVLTWGCRYQDGAFTLIMA